MVITPSLARDSSSPAVVATISAMSAASASSARWPTCSSGPAGVSSNRPRLRGAMSAAVNDTRVGGEARSYGQVCHGKISASTCSPRAASSSYRSSAPLTGRASISAGSVTSTSSRHQGWSIRFAPTPGRTDTGSAPSRASTASGPIPERISSAGEP